MDSAKSGNLRHFGLSGDFGEQLFRNAPVGIILCDAQFQILALNPAARKLLGVPEGMESPSLGKDIRQFPPFTRKEIAEITQGVQNGKTLEYESDYTSLFGKKLHLQLRTRGIFVDGTLQHIVFFFQDLTKINMALKKAKASENKYRLLVENMTDRVFRIDRNLHLTYLSEPPIDIANGGESIPFESLVLPKEWPAIRKNFNRILQGENIPPFEFHLRIPSGEMIPIEISAKGIRNARNEVVEIQGSARNVAIRQEMLKKLKASEAQFRNIAEKFRSGIAILINDSFY